MTTVVVVGGGIAGLDAARLLGADGFDVTVVEAANRWGGKLAPVVLNGVRLDAGAESILARRPEGVGQEESRHLAELGLIGEYLEGLPYRSRIMELTEDDWLSWSFGQQRQFLDDLQAKVTLYQQIYDNTDLWIALDGQRTGGDAVYPMPLDALP